MTLKFEGSPPPDYWITNKDEYYKDIPFQDYERSENERYIVWVGGVLARYDKRKIDRQELAALAFSNQLVFSDYLGWYKFVAYDKLATTWLFFGDNCGSQYLFMDREHARFSDRLLTLRKVLGAEAEVDTGALTDMVLHGTLFKEETLVKGLTKTDYEYYYILRDGFFERRSKKLPLLSETKGKKNLADILSPIIEEIGDKRMCAVCTGGTDSRSVLAALAALGKLPELVITGHKDNPDLKSAALVAACLGRELTVIDPSTRETDWLEKGYRMLDGMHDVVLGYRHYLKAMWAYEKGCAFEFGGVGGEFYKNSFYTPFRWIFRGERDHIFYRDMLLAAPCASWFGTALREALPGCEQTIDEIAAEAIGEQHGLMLANRIGYERVSASSGTITNGYSAVCCKIDPLMDRALVSEASREEARAHLLHMWQRKQIAKYCPALNDIPTDQGYSCSLKPLPFLADCLKKMHFVEDRVFNHIRRKMGLGFRSLEQKFWDDDYSEARKSELWQKALRYCCQNEFVREDVKEEAIPLPMTGILLLVGMLFADIAED